MRIILLLFGVVFPPQLLALTINFNCITYNNSVDCDTGESQFFVEISKSDEEKVLFTFTNNGSNQSFVSNIYFDHNNTIEYLDLVDTDQGVDGDLGVDFSLGSNPNNLPAANSLDDPFVSIVSFSNDPGAANGIQTGESLGIFFYLINNNGYDDLINEIRNSQFKIGLHGQGFIGGGSESFTNSTTVVPLPITAWLFGSGLMVLLGACKRSKRTRINN